MVNLHFRVEGHFFLPWRAASLPRMVNASLHCQQVTGIYKTESQFVYLISA